MPEFLQKRFQSQWIRTYLTVVALFSYVFTKFSVGWVYYSMYIQQFQERLLIKSACDNPKRYVPVTILANEPTLVAFLACKNLCPWGRLPFCQIFLKCLSQGTSILQLLPTIPCDIVTCTFTDDLSRNSYIMYTIQKYRKGFLKFLYNRSISMLAVCFCMKLLVGIFTSLLLVSWPSQLSTLSWVSSKHLYLL